jgi:hypothetical protein
MSLLTRGLTEDVVVFPEEVVTDMDGNVRTRPSAVGIPTRARCQPLGQSGTSSRRQEQDNEGFESERVYSIRFHPDFPVMGAQSQVEWQGVRWALFGTEVRYNSSRRTAHIHYTIKRF